MTKIVPKDVKSETSPVGDAPGSGASDVDWKDTALRLQAEMDNYRKRQARLAEERVQADRDRLLRAYLSIVDMLEYTLKHLPSESPGRNGVRVTLDAMFALLKSEGVARLKTVETAFDPHLHEATTLTAGRPDQPADLWIVAEEQAGYTLDERLLRPARVVVAKKSTGDG